MRKAGISMEKWLLDCECELARWLLDIIIIPIIIAKHKAMAYNPTN